MRQSVEKSDRPDRLRNLSLSPLTSALINVFKQVASLKRLYSQAPSPKAPPSVPEPGRIVFEGLEPRILLSADFTPVAPLVSMVEQAQQSGQLDGNTQSVDYHYSLDAGQRVSLAFTTPVASMEQPEVSRRTSA